MPKKTKKTGRAKNLRKKRGARGLFSKAKSPVENLQKIDHIVVLMMENRSFDHMLGYLTLEKGRSDVDGLTDKMVNVYNSVTHPVHHLTSTKFEQDPCHDGDCVDEQVSNNNGGFVSDFARHHPKERDPGKIMGYYNAANLPVYDHLAAEFCICDRWFCSVLGSTWPNRLYALTGHSNGKRENAALPVYSQSSFVRHLDAARVSWKWYSHDFETLRYVDPKYRVGYDGNFFKVEEKTIFETKDFFKHALAGSLPAVAWIDPNFVSVGAANANDDHPPADVLAGQDLVMRIYNALLGSPVWKKTLFIITYDEHGGFYDHVPPPPAADDDPQFRNYGVRVPAIIVSPWVKQGAVSHTVFDHTSIIKTILLRFCQKAGGSIPNMGARVENANHLGELLTRTSPRTATPAKKLRYLFDLLSIWKNEVWKNGLLKLFKRDLAPAQELNDFQKGLIAGWQEIAEQNQARKQ